MDDDDDDDGEDAHVLGTGSASYHSATCANMLAFVFFSPGK